MPSCGSGVQSQSHKHMKTPKIKVIIIESERGWGSKVDETKMFDTLEAAQKFVKKFNEPNEKDWKKTKTVPDWYMQAQIVSD